MRRKILVARADQIVAVPGLHVDQPVRPVMHAVEEDFGAGGMRYSSDRRDIDDRADRMRGDRAGDEASAIRHQRAQVVDMQIAVLAHAPPDEFRAGLLQRQPGRDVGVVVHVGDDDLVAFAKHLADAEADQADERRGVHAEADLGRILGIDEQRHAFACFGDRLVDLDAAAIAAAALHIVRDQMVGHRVEHALRDLRAGGVVEEDEGAGLLQGRKHRADGLDRECCGAFGLGGLVLVHVYVLGCEAKVKENGEAASLFSARLFDFELALEQADETHHRPQEK